LVSDGFAALRVPAQSPARGDGKDASCAEGARTGNQAGGHRLERPLKFLEAGANPNKAPGFRFKGEEVWLEAMLSGLKEFPFPLHADARVEKPGLFGLKGERFLFKEPQRGLKAESFSFHAGSLRIHPQEQGFDGEEPMLKGGKVPASIQGMPSKAPGLGFEVEEGLLREMGSPLKATFFPKLPKRMRTSPDAWGKKGGTLPLQEFVMSKTGD
jgi:hypothetical protein